VILYARQYFLAPDLGEFRSFQSEWEVPELADVPVPGTKIEPKWPICTVLASGLTSADCLKRLGDRVDTVWKMVNDRACRTVSIP
jgi:predicted ATP-grasp superfamily ATP-dependent carboligase